MRVVNITCFVFRSTIAKCRKFRSLNNSYIWQHVTSVNVLCELHGYESDGENIFPYIWRTYISLIFIIFFSLSCSGVGPKSSPERANRKNENIKWYWICKGLLLVLESRSLLAYPGPIEMETERYFEMSVRSHQTIRRHILKTLIFIVTPVKISNLTIISLIN
jgi:hypothetical protein